VKNEHPDNVLKWLRSEPSLDDLGAHFPELLESVRGEIAKIVASCAAAELPVYLKRLLSTEQLMKKKYHGSRGDKNVGAALVLQAVRTRMAHLAIKQHLIAEATGIDKGKVRFNLLNGYVAQKLLFVDALERKPVSMLLFRLLWPLLWQRKLLMPLVQPEGIYCFYSRQLVKALAALVGTRSCLEIAAGDGTLTRFLADCGVRITATDDYSWKHEVKYPGFVVRMDAREALREYTPEVVLCSWPPAGNAFEQLVFRTKSVKLYIVVSSRHRFAAGNWDHYLQQSAFEREEDEALSRLVLPTELDAAVYIFRRKEM